MTRDPQRDLTRRERQIMETIYRLGRATVAEVLAELPDPPGYSAVRAQLRLLEEKGQLRHEEQGPRYVYLPTVGRDKARRSALRNVLRNFFGGSTEEAVAALLELEDPPSADTLERLARMIEQARREGR
ncbi:MAG TPA: BlaI/MecI/CopY family transcriptional regulator [Thermoanaerobaculia bacterium]|nr:BlaI/MecI/CopY family transcriptional regulator [Thermoanaerobaculia bacterium]